MQKINGDEIEFAYQIQKEIFSYGIILILIKII